MAATQATYWLAQLANGTKMRGGQSNLFPDDVSVSAVPLDQIKVFTIAHNTFSDTYYAPSKTWYRNGKQWFDRPISVQYITQDGSLITVNNQPDGILDIVQA